jgi:signal transduction histidine kinase
MDLDRALNIYRITQEAIQNAIKHGDAKEIRVGLDFSETDAVLTIADNGRGIPPEQIKKTNGNGNGNGMGLKIMRHRADLIRGTVSILSPESGGTNVVCVFKKNHHVENLKTEAPDTHSRRPSNDPNGSEPHDQQRARSRGLWRS